MVAIRSHNGSYLYIIGSAALLIMSYFLLVNYFIGTAAEIPRIQATAKDDTELSLAFPAESFIKDAPVVSVSLLDTYEHPLQLDEQLSLADVSIAHWLMFQTDNERLFIGRRDARESRVFQLAFHVKDASIFSTAKYISLEWYGTDGASIGAYTYPIN